MSSPLRMKTCLLLTLDTSQHSADYISSWILFKRLNSISLLRNIFTFIESSKYSIITWFCILHIFKLACRMVLFIYKKCKLKLPFIEFPHLLGILHFYMHYHLTFNTIVFSRMTQLITGLSHSGTWVCLSFQALALSTFPLRLCTFSDPTLLTVDA